MINLEVVKYLRSGKTLASLMGAPYNLKVQERDGLVLLKYDQINSDFNIKICRECRGIILEKRTWMPVCFPFMKFFNMGEQYADTVSGKLYVYQKIDGSLAKVWYYNGRWHLSSNGAIDATEVTVGDNVNFFGLFLQALYEYGLTWESFTKDLDKNYTYMYELATQDNQVVIPYEGYHLFYLGQRNMNTYEEEYKPDQRIENVKVYDFETAEDVEVAAEQLPDDEEGYVVRDENWNRVKIKNPTYFMLHKLANNGKPDLLKYVLEHEESEFLSYFPEYTDEVQAIHGKLVKLGHLANYHAHCMSQFYFVDRGQFAKMVFSRGVPKYLQSFVFKTYEDHNLNWAEYTKDWDYYKWKAILSSAEGDL